MRFIKFSKQVFSFLCFNFPLLVALLAFSFPVFALGEHAARAEILINEVYYDHPGADQGYEFVELINTLDATLCLQGYTIEFHNGSGTGWSSIWAGSMHDTVSAGGCFVIGGEYVGAGVDVIADLGIQNGPDALRICRNGLEEDLVGYGELTDPLYFELSPAPDVPAGYSLGRSPDGKDTDNNRGDFAKMDPSPGLPNVPAKDLSIRMKGNIRAMAFDNSPVKFNVIVQNEGLEQIASMSYLVEIYDSTAIAVARLASLERFDSIMPGGSLDLELSFRLEAGYHFVTCMVKFPADERPSNNKTQLVLRIGKPEILISEVMTYPVYGCPQYVEIYNAGFGALDIAGWMIRDHAHSFSTVTKRSFFIEPKTYAILTSDSAALGVCFPNLERDKIIGVYKSWPYLNHSGSSVAADSIILADSFGLPAERVAYPPQEETAKGRSLERVDIYPGERRHIWNLCTKPGGGSPGCENEIVSFGPETGQGLKIHPNPFYPNHGGALLIEIPFIDGVKKVLVKIFDLRGHQVCDVGASSVLPAVFLWNGSGREGMLVPSGIYIVAAQMYLDDGGRMVERAVVGCGEKK